MASRPELFKHLELMSARIRNHHGALWEEEKHYSWWIYILFAGLVYIYCNGNCQQELRYFIIIALSLIGILVSIVASRVVKLEGRYLHQAIQLYQRTAIALGFSGSINDFISKEHFKEPFEEPFVPGLELRKWGMSRRRLMN